MTEIHHSEPREKRNYKAHEIEPVVCARRLDAWLAQHGACAADGCGCRLVRVAREVLLAVPGGDGLWRGLRGVREPLRAAERLARARVRELRERTDVQVATDPGGEERGELRAFAREARGLLARVDDLCARVDPVRDRKSTRTSLSVAVADVVKLLRFAGWTQTEIAELLDDGASLALRVDRVRKLWSGGELQTDVAAALAPDVAEALEDAADEGGAPGPRRWRRGETAPGCRPHASRWGIVPPPPGGTCAEGGACERGAGSRCTAVDAGLLDRLVRMVRDAEPVRGCMLAARPPSDEDE